MDEETALGQDAVEEMALITVAALMGYVRFYVDTKRQCKLDNRLNINSVGFEWLRRDYHNLIQIWTVLSRTRLRTIRDTLTYVNGHSSREPEMLFLGLIPRFPCLYWSTVGTGTAKPVDKSIAGTFCIIRRSGEHLFVGLILWVAGTTLGGDIWVRYLQTGRQIDGGTFYISEDQRSIL